MSWSSEQALIVDGDPQTRAAARSVLQAAGYECHEREDGAAALDLIREIACGLVVTELDLPDGDGMVLLRAARHRSPAVGVLVVSTRRDAESAVNVLQEGALDYVVKPASSAVLSRRISAAIERRRLLIRHDEYQRSLEQKVIQRARELQGTQQQILFTLSEAVAARHSETHTHTQRVTRLSLQLARALGIRGPALTGIEWGAGLHDVGKIGIPDAILLKPSSLTREEWEMMKQHCEIGHRMLRGFEFLRDALAVVLHHHERYDGNGYPHRLSGERIPFSARIFAVVDAYDAMTSDRPYRAPLAPEEAMEELARCAAAQFDPLVVDAFLNLSESTARGAVAFASA
jgi:putative two-component system response regulator